MFIKDLNYFNSFILKNTSTLLNVREIIKTKDSFYQKYSIPKKTGQRTIYAIKNTSLLYDLQKHLCSEWFNQINLSVNVKGFVKEESYTKYLSEHIKKDFYLRVDIKDFFPSISANVLRETLSDFTSSKEIIDIVIEICTVKNFLPQGAVTSPVLSNIVMRRIDQRITKYCQRFNIIYTRYADDLLFSSNNFNFKKNVFFIKMIAHILSTKNFKINNSKTIYSQNNISLSGYFLGENIHLSRNKLRFLNSILFFFAISPRSHSNKFEINKAIFQNPKYIDDLNAYLERLSITKLFKNNNELLCFLCGYRAFLIDVYKTSPSRRQSNKIDNIVTLIDQIEKMYG